MNRKHGISARLAVDRDRAAVLLGNDVVADRQTQPRALAGRLGREEGLEQLVPDLGRDAGTVVTHPYLDRVADGAGGYGERRPILRLGALAQPLGGGVEAVAEQIEEDASHLLRRQHDAADSPVIVPVDRNVECLILGAGAVISEV